MLNSLGAETITDLSPHRTTLCLRHSRKAINTCQCAKKGRGKKKNIHPNEQGWLDPGHLSKTHAKRADKPPQLQKNKLHLFPKAASTRRGQSTAGGYVSGEGKVPQNKKQKALFNLFKHARTSLPWASPEEGARVTRHPFSLSLKQRVLRRAARHARRGRPGPRSILPRAPVPTCLAKNLPSSLRLFSLLAAINRNGVAATSSERCSMTADPVPPAATNTPGFTLRVP